MSKVFAQAYPRNDKNEILFPRDLTERRKLMPESIWKNVSLHPSKMNLFLCQEIIRYVSEPGDTILDPFGGIGTTLVGALEGRQVITIELEAEYVRLQKEIVEYWLDNLADNITVADLNVYQGDNRQLLPFPCDHIITSPPYGNDMFKAEGSLIEAGMKSQEEANQKTKQYGDSTLSISRLNPFLYVQTMQKVYKLMVDSVRPGGSITITHRDRMRGDKRILYAHDIIRTLTGYGMKLHDIYKWHAPGSIQSRVNEKKGVESILDEDIILFRKPL